MAKNSENVNRISICTGKACRKKESEKLLNNFDALINDQGLTDTIHLETCTCLKTCKKGLSIQVMPEEAVVAGLKPKKAEKYLKQIIKGKFVEKNTS